MDIPLWNWAEGMQAYQQSWVFGPREVIHGGRK